MQFLHPSWSYDTNIYEVNVRQYTSEGTFIAFQKHLPRLKEMGVEILWFMPITPISARDRKGTLGSYYAVQNYTAVNPEFGSIQDFIELVKYAHHLGFKIIIDWVANHTGNDNVWINEHPEFFCYDVSNQIIHPHGWEDVSKLNYDNEQMQWAMINAMKFWIETCDIDGFRCDMAHLVPLEFWRMARTELQRTKTDLFWLAECEQANYHEVFDATYTWKWMHATEEFCKKQIDLKSLLSVLQEYGQSFPKEAFRVYFTSNHDENSWNGTEYEKYGEAAKALAVFSCTWNGIPMIYSGQELPNNKRLYFFDKDQVEWNEKCELHDFYKTLLHLRKTNTALCAADSNVIPYQLDTNNDDTVLAFVRKNANDEVLILLNLSADIINLHFNHNLLTGRFVEVFDKSVVEISEKQNLELQPWEYKLYEKEKAL
ncbi:MAG TPA: alpha-amylase family glycosyl hydrolase [Chitinophagaceae bacterium]|nr:alpha-amylase family glycosyl hydrolase [Chitinophagaceae bacterium]